MVARKRKPAPRVRINRRALLKGLAALAASSMMPPALAQGGSKALSAGGFSQLCRTLTGYTFGDSADANRMLSALVAREGAGNLSRIAEIATGTSPSQLDSALRSAGLRDAAERVVTALYTGMVESPKGTAVISYNQALVWQACAWTKPNAYCGGATNYWATAPANVVS